ncbi:methyltransferase, FxLD system [Thermomonospora catenispora]|uniref:methyltransferase, FxLD system n=1 Tax=Thermomonospora catenispora TaxID=2493090 RepID=UPI0019D66728|nr:methyltransferase, FxLD system [Thermomonospora catenispora]
MAAPITTRGEEPQDAAALRSAMVHALRERGAIVSEPVAAAMTAVPRHLFVPERPPAEAYDADNALPVKHDARGAATSTVSAPCIHATMLEQAGIEPGMRVLEIGSGGYNAALLAELVGDGGRVVSADIDPDIVRRARDLLEATGYDRVEVVEADAEHGVPDGAPYDRIIVTAGAWNIPPAWIRQLTENGRLVVPLRLKGLTRVVAFDRVGETLVGRDYRLAAFVPMQGAGAHSERLVPLDEGVMLCVDDEALKFDVEELRAALRGPRVERWSGAAFDLPDELELFLMTGSPRTALLHADEKLIRQGRFAPSAAGWVPALIADGGIAYRVKRTNEETGGFETGVFAHGPAAETLAERYVELLRRWAHRHRRHGAARIRYLPGGVDAPAEAEEPSGGLIPKRHGVVEVTWS